MPAARASTERVAGMTVTVRLSGVLAERLGSRRTIELAGAPTVEDVVAEVGSLAGLDPDALGGLAVVSGGSFLRRDHAVAEGEELDVLVPVAGG
jgi:sulfur carrier protein ThiS